jgi:DNA modification methylase
VTPYEQDGITLYCGDCREVLATLPDGSVDAVVSDPPYGLAFMGKKWDYDVPSVEVWQQCLRVLKPGGHLLAFAGTRTQHRMACRIEDAGFEIRDMIAWVYGSGFPKSLDVSKAIDKGTGENRARQLRFTEWMRSTGITAEQINAATNSNMASHYLTDKQQPAIATADMFDAMRPYLPEVPEEIERLVAERTGIEWTAYKQREVVGKGTGAISTRKELKNDKGTVWGADSSEFDITVPATEAAKQWQGWGTALKPSLEPLTLARKPLEGTVAANVLQYGTGALNVDGCRVGDEGGTTKGSKPQGSGHGIYGKGLHGDCDIVELNAGRWPANLIHDGSREATGILGEEARFFYCPKTSAAERGKGNNHPTVKPIDLMRYLCRMVTPPGGVVLDPFAGSGSTLLAARREGFRAIGIELNPEYCQIIRSRLGEPEEAASEVLEGQRTLF